ncbi:MAG: hypothetical protein ACK6DZ_23815, partial [Acidobacteriota bacterium]
AYTPHHRSQPGTLNPRLASNSEPESSQNTLQAVAFPPSSQAPKRIAISSGLRLSSTHVLITQTAGQPYPSPTALPRLADENFIIHITTEIISSEFSCLLETTGQPY